jgi:amidase
MTADLWALTATQTTQGIVRRDFTAREVAQATLARLEAVNPAINAVVQRMDDAALAAADAVDAAFARGDAVGPLAGVPVTVKVNVDQAGFATTNGLQLQAGLVAVQDSAQVANLRRAGAVIIGHTNTPAFSLRWFTRNSLHGATLNPRNPGLTPGGSSGGAGAAVAAGIGALAHGTDIAGSIRYPAYACGVHGLRPSLGRVAGFNPSAGDRLIGGQLMAVSGPLARSMADLRLGLAALSAQDLRDPWWQDAPLDGPPAPRRVALCPAPDGMAVTPEVRAAVLAAADRLANAGYEVAQVPTPPWAEAMEAQLRLWMAEFHHIGFGIIDREGDPDAAFVAARMRARLAEPSLPALMTDLQTRARLVRLWRAFLADWPLVLCPVSGEPPFADHRDVASDADFAAVLAAQLPMIAPPLMGLPGLAVASGPVGVQLLAGPMREDLLLAAGAVLAPGPVAPVTP